MIFGTPGWGGQMGYGDLQYQLGYAYLTNYLSQYSMGDDPLFLKLQKAVYEVVSKLQ